MKIDFVQPINASAKQVLSLLLDHNNLGRFFNAIITVVHPQDEGEVIGGKGTVRQIKSGAIVFKEQVLLVTPEHFSYKVIGKAPVSEHQGDIYLNEITTDGLSKVITHLHYVITCKGPKWLPEFIVKFIVEKDIKQAMKKLAIFCDKSLVI